MPRSLLSLASTLTFALGCGNPLTQIVVVVDGDLRVPDQMDAVTVEVTGMQSASGTLVGAGALPFPRTVGLVPSGGSLGPITVRAIGTFRGTPVVERVAITSFVEGRTLELPMYLSQRCQGVTCADGETCDLSRCLSATIDGSRLRDYDGMAGRIDGGSCPVINERCNGADDDCDGRIDEDFDLTNDPVNCGSCLNACLRPHATVACVDSMCTVTGCAEGFGDCNDTTADGCESALDTPAHCGQCDNVCSLPNSDVSCDAGACVSSGCSPGFDDCNGDPSDGCEAALDTVTDCGACGVPCTVANGTGSCATGTCVVDTCAAGFGDCNAMNADGCERALDTLTDCGGCDAPCSRAHATATCATGSCEIETCAAGFGDCNGMAADGCERSLSTTTDCGSCGTPCTIANGTGTCASGTCAVMACNTNYGECNAMASDGCETDVRRDPLHCGTCGTVCMAPTTMCVNSVCR
ncbi:MAG: hypothetical protein AB7S26_28020 [Sandaracinaceae bacterium]